MISWIDLFASLNYNPETGVWTRVLRSGRGLEGTRADLGLGHKYNRVSIGGRRYYAHILAVKYMTGSWPECDVDHKDVATRNNRWNNLRKATRGQNAANKQKQKDKTSKLKGVFWQAHAKRWRSQICVNKKRMHIGYYKTELEAAQAYAERATFYHGEFARHDA